MINYRVPLIALFLLFAQPVFGKNTLGGFLDFNVYPHLTDVDNDNTLTINAAARFKNRFSYFSLLNFSNQAGGSELSDLDTYYTEQNLRWQVAPASPFDLTVQLNFRSGEDNDRHRLGVRWRLNDTAMLKGFFDKLNMRWAVNLHAIQFDHEPGHVWQLEHSFGMKFPSISPSLYLAGFIDHTFNQDLPDGFPSSPIVGEVQLGYEVASNFFLIAEYRVNQYRRSDVNNLALGVEYKFVW